MTGRTSSRENCETARIVHERWKRLRARHGNSITWRHARAHTGVKWNEHVDAKAELGRLGDVKSTSTQWMEAIDAMAQTALTCERDRYVVKGDRMFIVRVREGRVEIGAKGSVDLDNLRLVRAGLQPRIQLQDTCGDTWQH